MITWVIEYSPFLYNNVETVGAGEPLDGRTLMKQIANAYTADLFMPVYVI